MRYKILISLVQHTKTKLSGYIRTPFSLSIPEEQALKQIREDLIPELVQIEKQWRKDDYSILSEEILTVESEYPTPYPDTIIQTEEDNSNA